ncbi:ACP S-malonyltransferase [Streptomyces sp. NPDC086080]|uniref:ACP S-malonyltransferase n=1 Tax=Streptomyces sp. NPDC086080 TaxID=3365748 RepID=UPI0037D7635A
MALASVFGTNLFHYDPKGVVEFYEAYPAVRASFEQAARWTELEVEPLLYQNGTYENETLRIRAVSVGLAAAQLGIQDVLADKGLLPDVVGGLSLGGLVASCVAGAVERQDLMRMLAEADHDPEPADAGRPEGLASAYLTPGFDPDRYYGERREGVFLSADFGYDAQGRVRITMLSGYRDALEKLAAEEPEGLVNVTEGADLAVHSPLREHLREVTRAQVAPVVFQDPRLPLCSCLEQRTLGTAEEVREMFVDNVVKPISLVHLNEELRRHETELALVVGPSPVMNALRYPFPAVFVDSPAAVAQAVAAVFEHGVRLRRA